MWILSALVLLAKAIRWKGLSNHPSLSTPIRVAYALAAISFVPLSVFWTEVKRGQRPWSSIQTLAIQHAVTKFTSEQQSKSPKQLTATAPMQPQNIPDAGGAAPPAAVRKPIVKSRSNTTSTKSRGDVVPEPAIPIDKDLELVSSSVDSLVHCYGFLKASNERHAKVRKDIQAHDDSIDAQNLSPQASSQSKAMFNRWRIDQLIRDDANIYSQVYKDEFVQIRKRLAREVPEEVEPHVDEPGDASWSPYETCSELQRMIRAYVTKLYEEKRISPEQGKKYFQLIERAEE